MPTAGPPRHVTCSIANYKHWSIPSLAPMHFWDVLKHTHKVVGFSACVFVHWINVELILFVYFPVRKLLGKIFSCYAMRIQKCILKYAGWGCRQIAGLQELVLSKNQYWKTCSSWQHCKGPWVKIEQENNNAQFGKDGWILHSAQCVWRSYFYSYILRADSAFRPLLLCWSWWRKQMITLASDFSNLVGKAFCMRARDNSKTLFPAILKGIYHA